MTPIEILERIIKAAGSCTWIRGDVRAICDNCPINGDNWGCAEFSIELSKDGKRKQSEQDKSYMGLAQRKLIEIAFEEMMGGAEYDKK